MYIKKIKRIILVFLILNTTLSIQSGKTIAVKETENEKTRIYIYYDPEYPHSWISETESKTLTNNLLRYFQNYNVHCEAVNASNLSHIMNDLENASETIIVCAQDVFPDTVWDGNKNSSPEQWIKAGGLLVWTGDVEFYFIGYPDGTLGHERHYPRIVFGQDLTTFRDNGLEITELDNQTIPGLENFISYRPTEKSQLSGLEYEVYGRGLGGRKEFYDPLLVWLGDGALVKIVMNGHQAVSQRSQWISEFISNRFNLSVKPPLLKETVFYNGTIITMDDDLPLAEAVLVQDEIILSVGSNEEILNLAGEEADKINLQGRTMLPGFIDAHSHWTNDLFEVDSIEEAIDMSIRHGWTSTSQLFTYPELIDELLELDSRGEIRNRLNLYLRLSYQYQRWTDWYKDYPPGEMLAPMIRVAGVKMFADGTHGDKTVAFSEPYPSNPYNYGTLFFTQSELEQLVSEAHNAGYQIAIHAIGDAAIEQVLDAYEAALGDETNEDHRHRIEHVLYLRDDLISRMADMGIVASFQSHWGSSDSTDFYTGHVGEERLVLLARWRDLLDSGAPAAASTDYPYCTYGSTVIHGIYNLVTRVGPHWGVEPIDCLKDQRLTVEEAIRLMTIDAAYATFQEDVVGSITPGKYGDLVVLSANPLEVEPEELIDLSVWMTVVGGKIEYWSENPGTCMLDVSVEGPGQVELPPGRYGYPSGFTLDLNAASGDPVTEDASFSYWVLDDEVVEGSEEISVSMDSDHELTAVFIADIPGEAVFEVSDIVVEPSIVLGSETVSISVEVSNTGTESGCYNVTLKIDGETVDEVEVAFDPGVSESIEFTVEDMEPGSYSVNVNGLTGSFEVKVLPPDKSDPLYLYLAIGAVILLASLLLFMRQRQTS